MYFSLNRIGNSSGTQNTDKMNALELKRSKFQLTVNPESIKVGIIKVDGIIVALYIVVLRLTISIILYYTPRIIHELI